MTTTKKAVLKGRGFGPNFPGKATWGALLGPYHFMKLKDFASEVMSQTENVKG
jgi:hypothetical protein